MLVLVQLGCCNKISWTKWIISNEHLFRTVLEARKSKINVPVSSVSGEGSLVDIVPSHGRRGMEAL